MSTRALVDCMACGGEASQEPYYYEWRGQRWWLHRCAVCSLQFVWPRITADDRRLIFGEKYFSAEGDWACGHFSGASYDDAEGELRKEAREVLRLLGPARGRLLDIGCAGGVFLDEARQHGWDVAGIEVNATMAARALKRGLHVWHGPAEETPGHVFGEPFDVVVLMDTLEHIPEPWEVMARVSAWTRAPATILIRGPLTNSAIDQAKEGLRRLLWIPKQLPGYPLDANNWSRRSLEHLVVRFGFGGLSWHNVERGFGTLIATRRTLRAR